MPDIVEIIKDQHRQVDRLLSQAAEDGADTAALLREVARLLMPHSAAEEDFVYPTIRDKASRKEREEMGRRFVEATSGTLPTEPREGREQTKQELYEKAKEQHIPGRSKMSKDELAEAVGSAADK